MIKNTIQYTIRRLSLFAFTVFLTAGCTPSVNKVDPLKYYTLHYHSTEHSTEYNTEHSTEVKADKAIYDFVKVDLPHISTKHMTESIIYSKKPFQKNSYSQSHWKEPLPIMLQEWMAQSINNSKLFKGVIRVASRANVPLMLETDIVKFEHIVYKDRVNVSLRVILIQYKQRKIIKHKLFNYQVKVEDASAEGAVLSFNEALKQFNQDLFLWLKNKDSS